MGDPAEKTLAAVLFLEGALGQAYVGLLGEAAAGIRECWREFA
jgi:hypothetical protein